MFDDPKNKIKKIIKLQDDLIRKCYGCGKLTNLFHFDYVYSCVNCGNKFMKYRYYSTT
jgi:rRNA maturation endonuclease Nob1